MAKLKMPEYHKQGIIVQMVPLIDIMLFTLILFIYISVYSQTEANLEISVPKATTSTESAKTPSEIIVNITKDGRFIINDQTMDIGSLENMLQEAVAIFPDQQIIIRADENAYHKFVVAAMDACAKAGILNISFATVHTGDEVR